MATNLVQYLDKATETLGRFGIDVFSNQDQGEAQLVNLLGEISHIDEGKVMAISQVVGVMSAYNTLVRENVAEMKVADRYNDVNEAFNSVLDDSKMLVEHVEDGKIDLGEKVQQLWMKMVRGNVSDRYQTVIEIGGDVLKDTKGQLDREGAVLDAYQNFRLALKSSEAIAYEVKEKQQKILSAAEKSWKDTQTALDSYTGKESEISSLELARDEAAMKHKTEDRNYGLIKRIAENIKVGYNAGEVIMAKLDQTNGLKRDLYEGGVTFFTTNEHVLTGLSAAHTSMLGLNETAQTIEATKAGMNRGLEYLAEVGGKVNEVAIEAAHGATLSSDSVGKLIDSIVNYQENSTKLIATARERATNEALKIEEITEEGKRRVQAAILEYKPQTA